MKTVVLRIPEIDYNLVHWSENEYTPWVAAWGHNEEAGYWSQGHYFRTKYGALKYLESVLKEKSKLDELSICQILSAA